MLAYLQQIQHINYKALITTIVVHALLFLLFFFLKYAISQQLEIPVGSGMEINLGTTDDGLGNDQLLQKNKPAPFQSTVKFNAKTTSGGDLNNIYKSNLGDETTLNNNVSKNDDKKDSSDKNRATLPQVPKYAYQGTSEQINGGNNGNQDNQATSEGNGTNAGDKGQLNGTPGAGNYNGIPGGNGGIGHNLAGRIIKPDKFEAEFREGGKVVIHVTVNRNGDIIEKRVVSSSSSVLTKIALEKINAAHFSKSTGSEPQQFGDVTLVFKTR